MFVLSLERLGAVNRQADFVHTLEWVNGLIGRGKPVYQCVKDIFVETSLYPEGHIYPAGTLLFENVPDMPGDVLMDETGLLDFPAGEWRALRLPRQAGVYNGLNCAAFCFDPYRNILNACGIPFIELQDRDIRGGALKKCDLLIVPGGPDAGESYYAGLGEGGMREIREFIAGGGKYLGSCAGAYLPLTARRGAPEERMCLNAVDATDPSGLDYWRTGTGFVRISLESPGHPALFGLAYGSPSTVDVIYWEGPVFHIGSNVRVLASFRDFIASGEKVPNWSSEGNPCAVDALKWSNPLTQKRFDVNMKDMPAAVEASFGEGRLLLFSFHPEFGSPYCAWEKSPTHLFVINSIYDLCAGK